MCRTQSQPKTTNYSIILVAHSNAIFRQPLGKKILLSAHLLWIMADKTIKGESLEAAPPIPGLFFAISQNWTLTTRELGLPWHLMMSAKLSSPKCSHLNVKNRGHEYLMWMHPLAFRLVSATGAPLWCKRVDNTQLWMLSKLASP